MISISIASKQLLLNLSTRLPESDYNSQHKTSIYGFEVWVYGV